MDFQINHAIELLLRTPAAIRALLTGISDPWARSNYGKDTFSPFDVVGHLIHAERTNWMTRLRIILAHGQRMPLPPFDRYAMYETSKGRTIDELLEEFVSLRAASIEELRSSNLTPERLALRGVHPDLGIVTAAQLIAAWTVHDLGHTHQIAKAMAHQYRDLVGPWRKYLTILPRED